MNYYTVEGNKKSIKRVFAIYYACMALFCLVRVIATFGTFSNGVGGDILFTFLIQVCILAIFPFIMYMVFLKVKPKEVFQHCNFFHINIPVVLISLGLGVICFIINVAVSTLFNGILTFTGYEFSGGSSVADYSTGNFFLQLFLVAVLPAICEEFLHRGVLLQGIKHIGFKKAIVISSLLFALIHFNVQQVFYAFIIGLILGFVAVVSKNIYPAMIIHFVNNGIATYLEFAGNRGWAFGNILDNLSEFLKSNTPFVVFTVVVIVMLVVVALLCLFIWLLYKQSIIRKVNKAINKAYSHFSVLSRNNPIHVGDEHDVMLELLENNTLLNLDFKPMDNPIDIVLPKERSRYKSSRKDRVFMWAAIVMGGMITLFTYIWGLF
jgi:membrane protease YdiL (CAAX protease family)